MDLGQIDVLHVIGTVIVLDLPTCPVDAFDLDDLAIFYGSIEGDYIFRESMAYGWRGLWVRDRHTVGMPSILR